MGNEMSDSPNITFRPIQLADASLLFAWRQKPHVAAWWNVAPYEAGTYEEVEEEIREDLELGGHDSFFILLDGEPIGYGQTYNAGDASGDWWPDEDETTGGLDLLIGEESLTGRGLGPLVVRAICQRIFSDPKIQSIIADPNPENTRSVRCFEKAGFTPERQMQTPDGNALLMRLRRESP